MLQNVFKLLKKRVGIVAKNLQNSSAVRGEVKGDEFPQSLPGALLSAWSPHCDNLKDANGSRQAIN